MRPIPLVLAGLLALVAVAVRRRLGRTALLVAFAVAALLAVYGSGLVPLPSPERVVEEVGTTLGAWTYVLVGALAFLEAAAFVGLVAPGEFAVVFGGLIAGRGDIDLVTLIAVVWACSFSGDVVSYWFGRIVGRGFALRHGHRFGVTPARLEWAEAYFASHGGKTILVGRFIGIVRALAPFIAGTSRMPFRVFAAVDVVGTGAWSTTFSVLGYVFWQSLDRALEYASRGKLGLGAVLLVAAVAIVLYRLLRAPEDRRRLAAWVRRKVGLSPRPDPVPARDED